jgi:hypothetical protein
VHDLGERMPSLLRYALGAGLVNSLVLKRLEKDLGMQAVQAPCREFLATVRILWFNPNRAMMQMCLAPAAK